VPVRARICRQGALVFSPMPSCGHVPGKFPILSVWVVPMRCTVTRKVSPLVSKSSTRRTTFRSADHNAVGTYYSRPRRSIWPAPDRTLSRRPRSLPLLPERKSPRAAAKVSEVMPEGLHRGQGLVCDG
jgi:hypothetical protein